MAVRVFHYGVSSKIHIEGVKGSPLFVDVLQELWRQRLNLYKIVSFDEGIGDVDLR